MSELVRIITKRRRRDGSPICMYIKPRDLRLGGWDFGSYIIDENRKIVFLGISINSLPKSMFGTLFIQKCGRLLVSELVGCTSNLLIMLKLHNCHYTCCGFERYLKCTRSVRIRERNSYIDGKSYKVNDYKML